MACMCREMCFHGSKCLPGVLKTLSLKVLRTVFTTLFHFSKFNGISCPPWILKGFYPFRFMNEKRLNNFPSMLDALAKTLLLKNVVVIFLNEEDNELSQECVVPHPKLRECPDRLEFNP